MRTLVINGSPRHQGDSAALWREMRRQLAGDVVEISAYYGGIMPCVDCRYCWTHPGCAIDDPMRQIYDTINGYDNVILISPIYYSQMTGPLLSLASRLQTYWAARSLRGERPVRAGKQGVLIFSGGGDGSHLPAEETGKSILRKFGAAYVGSVMSLHTNNLPAAEDEVALAQARDMALRLNARNAGKV